MSLDIVFALLALGVATGFLAGLLGIGGGMLMVPFLTALLQAKGAPEALAVKMAIATSMTCIVATAASSLRAHHQRGAVRWDLVRGLAPGVVVGGLLSGAALFGILKGQALAGLFACFVGLSAWQMWRGAQPKPSRGMPGLPGQTAVGGGIGLLSGLVGAGGGFASVPFMTWCNVPIHQAVATSAALGLPIAAASSLGYVISGWGMNNDLVGAWGYLYGPALACLMPTTVLVAPWGARLAHALPVKRLKRAFALLLAALAAYMLTKAL
jgi:uncharacterized membrane protein YfcA